MPKKNEKIKNDMRTMQKPIIDAEAFMKFFEETTGAKFVDVKVLEKKSKNNKSKK